MALRPEAAGQKLLGWPLALAPAFGGHQPGSHVAAQPSAAATASAEARQGPSERLGKAPPT